MTMLHRNIIRIALGTGLLLLIPLVLTLTGSGVDGQGFHWTLFDFVVMGSLLFGAGLAYELVARKSEQILYRAALAVGVMTAVLLVWVNGAVGIIGSENQPANLLYLAVLAAGIIGSFIARFNPLGMARTLFTAAAMQMAVPGIALWIWPQLSWGVGGMFRVWVLNSTLAVLFVASALLFRRAAGRLQPPGAGAGPPTGA